MKSILKRAVSEALRADHKHFQMGAVIFKGDKIVSSGHNIAQRVIPRSIDRKYIGWPNSYHAEVAALLAANKVKGKSILIVRVNCRGKMRFAKPCSHCLSLLIDRGIKNIFYTTDDYLEDSPVIAKIEF